MALLMQFWNLFWNVLWNPILRLGRAGWVALAGSVWPARSGWVGLAARSSLCLAKSGWPVWSVWVGRVGWSAWAAWVHRSGWVILAGSFWLLDTNARARLESKVSSVSAYAFFGRFCRLRAQHFIAKSLISDRWCRGTTGHMGNDEGGRAPT